MVWAVGAALAGGGVGGALAALGAGVVPGLGPERLQAAPTRPASDMRQKSARVKV